MRIKAVNPREHAEKQETVKEPSQSSVSKPGSSAVDAAFEALMHQLLGAIVQNGQQMMDASKQTAPTTTVSEIESALVGELPDRTAVRQAELSAPVFPGLQEAVETSDAGKAAEAVAAAVQSAAGQEDDPKPFPKTTARETGDVLYQAGVAPTAAEDAQSELYGAVKTDYQSLSRQQEGDADAVRTRSVDSAPHRESAEPVFLKSDLSGLVQQDSAAARVQDGHAVSHRGADAAGSHAPVHPRAAEPAELFDHAVSIVKDGNRLAVKLEPEGLGKLDINISFEKGMVNTQIQVSDAATRTLIENTMQQLVQSLLSEGLAVGGFSVAMDGGKARDGAAEAPEDSGRNRRGSAVSAVEAINRPVAQGLVSIFV